jgi:hypothetical protein
VTAATSCLQLIIIASWILYRRTLLIESEQRRREREKPREWLSPPRQTRDESANQISRMPLFSTPRGAMHATPQVTPAVKTGKSLDLKLKEIKKKLKIPEEEDEAITAEVLADMVPIDGTVDQKISELHEKLMSTCLVPPAHPRSCAHSVHMCMIPTTALSSCTSCPHAPILFPSPAIAHASVPPPVPTLRVCRAARSGQRVGRSPQGDARADDGHQDPGDSARQTGTQSTACTASSATGASKSDSSAQASSKLARPRSISAT